MTGTRVTVADGVALARHTTIGIGGPASAFVEARTAAEVEAAVALAAERDLPLIPLGLGSNVLVPDDGIDAVVVKLAGELAVVDLEGTIVSAGGGAANAVCLHRVREAGLGGFEFACAIPGTLGGGVRMNAGAYGGDWNELLLRALVVGPEGTRWRGRDELDLSYRHSSLLPGEVVVRVELRLVPRPREEIRARVADLQARRKAAQPTNRRTFGSVFKNPPHELGAGQLIEACGLKGHRIGGAVISPRHANFIENAGGARASHAVALMTEARRRVREQFGVLLEREVELLGDLELPDV
jgi:UDP-N-acetylmuramate dehydrogenase